MESNHSEQFDERQSLQVIQEMIHLSQRKIKSDGILLIVWGYAMSLMSLIKYFKEILFLPNRVMFVLKFADPVLPLLALTFTIYYFYTQKKKATTYIGASLRYVWISLFFCLVLTNLILFNKIQDVNFSLQHPLFMVFLAFSLVVTGIILRFRLIILGGIFFGILAYWCSFLELQQQIFLEGIAWLIALVIPGHILYYKRNK